ncbi:MAG: helix-hairpin-helix domain-containing protein [Opitutales bacterium]|nr:helix-hairpin-helix domain-containing protein [Opitutales bacterium]MCH8539433.1 helix-hairpin-helix domain-containing protein [Opitutales bacterium]
MNFHPLITAKWWPFLTFPHGSRKCCGFPQSADQPGRAAKQSTRFSFNALGKASEFSRLPGLPRTSQKAHSSSLEETPNVPILEESTPGIDTDALLNRKVPGGRTEQEILLVMNTGRARELRKFQGFGPKIAANIMKFRRKEKFFTSLDELVRVPLIGPVRFTSLVGRESLFYTHPLHAILRYPPSRDITINYLQPLLWPTPEIPRIFLGNPEDTLLEQRQARIQNHLLRMHRIGRSVLFIHQKTKTLSGWSDYVQKHLPRLLRKNLNNLDKS